MPPKKGKTTQTRESSEEQNTGPVGIDTANRTGPRNTKNSRKSENVYSDASCRHGYLEENTENNEQDSKQARTTSCQGCANMEGKIEALAKNWEEILQALARDFRKIVEDNAKDCKQTAEDCEQRVQHLAAKCE